MAIRREDLMPERDALILRFPTRVVHARAARRRRMQVRRRRTAAVAAALALIVVFLLATGPTGSAPASNVGAPKAVTLHEGDSLWSVAEAYAPEGMDLRAYVDALEDLNGLEGGVHPGMRLKLPR